MACAERCAARLPPELSRAARRRGRRDAVVARGCRNLAPGCWEPVTQLQAAAFSDGPAAGWQLVTAGAEENTENSEKVESKETERNEKVPKVEHVTETCEVIATDLEKLTRECAATKQIEDLAVEETSEVMKTDIEKCTYEYAAQKLSEDLAVEETCEGTKIYIEKLPCKCAV